MQKCNFLLQQHVNFEEKKVLQAWKILKIKIFASLPIWKILQLPE